MRDQTSHLSFRKANKADEALLFNWANDHEVRKWSFRKDLIHISDHKDWFEKKINDPDILIWIFEKDFSPAGMVRLEKNNNEIILNYLLSLESRGKGMAVKMLKMAIKDVMNYWKNLSIVAYALPGNKPSIKSLIKAGFYLQNENVEKMRFIYSKTEKKGNRKI
jgi:UDP-2,4-diacetamido-2,4,6-trideoxy-beta-L-altropyranose hydrolase